MRATFGLLSIVLGLASSASAAAPQAVDPVYRQQAARLLGIYVSASPSSTPKASPLSLDSLPLIPSAATVRIRPDPKDLCQVLGPFRTMARGDVKFEILRDAPNKLVMVFENASWGHLRTIALDAAHSDTLAKARPLWNGDSVAIWSGDTLVIDSIHFTDRTWLNDAGVSNSRQLHLTERLRLLGDGKVLEYRATAVDPAVLSAPVSYTRYFERTTQEIQDYDCLAHKPVGAAASH